MKQVISRLFEGSYSYVTRCEGCGNVSTVESSFYELELNIQGHKVLQDCLSEFLKVRKINLILSSLSV